MSNHLTRIEREALVYAEKTWEHFRPCIERTAHIGQSLADYSRGKIEEYNRAAPVVKALEEIIADFHVYYDAEYAQADWYNNNTPHVGQTIPYASYPRIPKYIEHAKQILETYKADV